MAHSLRVVPGSRDGGILERSHQRILIAGVAAATLGVAFTCYLGRGVSPPRIALIPGDRGPAFTVEVLNATEVGGLARNVTRHLRNRGIDVVYFGSSSGRGAPDSTIIFIRRGDSAAALAVRKALGAGRITVELDPDRLLDASVLVGRDLATSFDRYP